MYVNGNIIEHLVAFVDSLHTVHGKRLELEDGGRLSSYLDTILRIHFATNLTQTFP